MPDPATPHPDRPDHPTRSGAPEASRTGRVLPLLVPLVAYGTPTKYEITLYRVTITRFGQDNGWSVELLSDEALGYGGLTLAECPRAALNAPPKPFRF